MARKAELDVKVTRHGTLYLFALLTPAADSWVDSHTPEESSYWGHQLVVEHRYAHDLAQGMLDDGLQVQ